MAVGILAIAPAPCATTAQGAELASYVSAYTYKLSWHSPRHPDSEKYFVSGFKMFIIWKTLYIEISKIEADFSSKNRVEFFSIHHGIIWAVYDKKLPEKAALFYSFHYIKQQFPFMSLIHIYAIQIKDIAALTSTV